MSMRMSTLALAVSIAFTGVLHADNWPQWRGPAATGTSSETGLPERWSDTENVAWKSPLRGLGISSPIVWGDRVFVTSQVGRSVRRPGNHPTLVQGASHSLVHYNGLLYMAGDVGVLSAIDAKTGQRVWQERTGGVFTASPVAADGKIYMLSEDGQTIVLAGGPAPRVLSRNHLNARQLASPAISGGRLFIRTDDALFAIGR